MKDKITLKEENKGRVNSESVNPCDPSVYESLCKDLKKDELINSVIYLARLAINKKERLELLNIAKRSICTISLSCKELESIHNYSLYIFNYFSDLDERAVVIDIINAVLNSFSGTKEEE